MTGPTAFAQEYFAPILVDAQGNKASMTGITLVVVEASVPVVRAL